MKILMVVLALCFMVSVGHATTVDNKVSGNTVYFRSIEWSIPTGGNLVTPTIVTFNSVTRHIKLMNMSTVYDCYVDITCVDANGKRGHITSNSSVILLPALGRISPNTVEFDFSTHNLGFIGKTTTVDTGNDNNKVTYVVTGDSGSL